MINLSPKLIIIYNYKSVSIFRCQFNSITVPPREPLPSLFWSGSWQEADGIFKKVLSEEGLMRELVTEAARARVMEERL